VIVGAVSEVLASDAAMLLEAPALGAVGTAERLGAPSLSLHHNVNLNHFA
jgi:hypothetical protein